MNLVKILDKYEVANSKVCDGEIAIEIVSGLVNPTQIVDEGDVETSHEAICLD